MGVRGNAMRNGLGAFLNTLGGELSDVRDERRAGDRLKAESGRRMGEMTLRQALEQADPSNKAKTLLTEQQMRTSASQGRAADADAERTRALTESIPTETATRATSAEAEMSRANTSAAQETRIGETTNRAVETAQKKLTAAETKTEKVRAWVGLRDAQPTKYWEVYKAADEDVVDSDVFKSWLTTFRKQVIEAAEIAGGGGATSDFQIGETGAVVPPAGPPAAPAPAISTAPTATTPAIGDTHSGEFLGDTRDSTYAQEAFGRGGSSAAGPVTQGLAQRAVDAGMADTIDAAISELQRRGADISK